MKTQPSSPRLNSLGGAASLAIAMLLACFSLSANADKLPAGFTERDAEVNGVRIHYSIGGKGSPVVLLHGYAQTS
ncbi:MAG TPA: alpha/beta hydrolase, partial [Verrucomicrobiae bacterium]|nr:alpha/beta hydrolase [Verrucomicrobiae bacterium]